MPAGEGWLWLALTLGVYVAALHVYARYRWTRGFPPVLVTIVVLAAVLAVTGRRYEDYLDGVRPLVLLLGPATVALALPLVRVARELRRALLPVVIALLVGTSVGLGSVWLIALAMGEHGEVALAMLPKSVTTPVALGLADQIGAAGSLAAVFSIVTGVLGASVGLPLLSLLRVRDRRARGLAMGVAAHGIGTARALDEHPRSGGWSSAGMVSTALLTTAVLPAAVQLLWR
jgi:predicted murein hydrolase (TIGR00659 family)